MSKTPHHIANSLAGPAANRSCLDENDTSGLHARSGHSQEPEQALRSAAFSSPFKPARLSVDLFEHDLSSAVPSPASAKLVQHARHPSNTIIDMDGWDDDSADKTLSHADGSSVQRSKVQEMVAVYQNQRHRQQQLLDAALALPSPRMYSHLQGAHAQAKSASPVDAQFSSPNSQQRHSISNHLLPNSSSLGLSRGSFDSHSGLHPSPTSASTSQASQLHKPPILQDYLPGKGAIPTEPSSSAFQIPPFSQDAFYNHSNWNDVKNALTTLSPSNPAGEHVYGSLDSSEATALANAWSGRSNAPLSLPPKVGSASGSQSVGASPRQLVGPSYPNAPQRKSSQWPSAEHLTSATQPQRSSPLSYSGEQLHNSALSPHTLANSSGMQSSSAAMGDAFISPKTDSFVHQRSATDFTLDDRYSKMKKGAVDVPPTFSSTSHSGDAMPRSHKSLPLTHRHSITSTKSLHSPTFNNASSSSMYSSLRTASSPSTPRNATSRATTTSPSVVASALNEPTSQCNPNYETKSRIPVLSGGYSSSASNIAPFKKSGNDKAQSQFARHSATQLGGSTSMRSSPYSANDAVSSGDVPPDDDVGHLARPSTAKEPSVQLTFGGRRHNLRAAVLNTGLPTCWTVMQSNSSKRRKAAVVASNAAGRGTSMIDRRKSVIRRSRDSLLSQLTMLILDTYHQANSEFNYAPRHNPRRVLTKPSKPARNEGFDNEDNDYILYVNETLGDDPDRQYVIIDVLGQGTFGQVVKCQNIKTKEQVAVKVVKNKPAYFNQSLMEVNILELLNQKFDKKDAHHIIRLKNSFVYRRHLCLVFEQLSINLYELIKQNQFRGVSLNLVRVFSVQILDSLTCLADAKLIHCDLKPENILLKDLQGTAIKVIDFGSACQEHQTVYSYIQSRFYRSPEVLLGLPYTNAIDIWSLGCIVAELYLGLPLFPGTSEYNQISRIVEMMGLPPNHMIEVGKNTKAFFVKVQEPAHQPASMRSKPPCPLYKLKSRDQYSREFGLNEQSSKRYFSGTTLREVIMHLPLSKRLSPGDVECEMQQRECLLDFLKGLLNLNPIERWSAAQAKNHPFITGAPYRGPWSPSIVPRRVGSSIPHTNAGSEAKNSTNSSSPSLKEKSYSKQHLSWSGTLHNIEPGADSASSQSSGTITPQGPPADQAKAESNAHSVLATSTARAQQSAEALASIVNRAYEQPANHSSPSQNSHAMQSKVASPIIASLKTATPLQPSLGQQHMRSAQERRKSSIADLTASIQNRMRRGSSMDSLSEEPQNRQSAPEQSQQSQRSSLSKVASEKCIKPNLSVSTGKATSSEGLLNPSDSEVPPLHKGRSQSISTMIPGLPGMIGSSGGNLGNVNWPMLPQSVAHGHSPHLSQMMMLNSHSGHVGDDSSNQAYAQGLHTTTFPGTFGMYSSQSAYPLMSQGNLLSKSASMGNRSTRQASEGRVFHSSANASPRVSLSSSELLPGGFPANGPYGLHHSLYGYQQSGLSSLSGAGTIGLPTWNPTSSRIIPSHLEVYSGITTDDEDWRDMEEGGGMLHQSSAGSASIGASPNTSAGQLTALDEPQTSQSALNQGTRRFSLSGIIPHSLPHSPLQSTLHCEIESGSELTTPGDGHHSGGSVGASSRGASKNSIALGSRSSLSDHSSSLLVAPSRTSSMAPNSLALKRQQLPTRTGLARDGGAATTGEGSPRPPMPSIDTPPSPQ